LTEEGGWIVVSIDRFKKSTAEREMMRRQGLTVFVLDRQWSKPYWAQAAQLVLWWPKIIDVAKLTSKTALRVALALQQQEHVRADPGVTGVAVRTICMRSACWCCPGNDVLMPECVRTGECLRASRDFCC